eukprot:TRINITY_DN9816_c0_g1_i1.p1 TRINITY_DN9816_c0_g1~~TRINITY_DN9816_c0_g1_i1.p1  ORF type:complete len:720 (+),score=135.02 TRINITY_DN9816_c0_g1_i1:313-2160(+)
MTLAKMSFPLLEHITGDIIVTNATELSMIDLGSVVSVGGDIIIDQAIVSEFKMNHLLSAKSLTFTGLPNLEVIQFEDLVKSSSVLIENIASNISVQFPAIENIYGSLVIEKNLLQSLNFANVISIYGDLSIIDNLGLTEINFPYLERAGLIHVKGISDGQINFDSLNQIDEYLTIEYFSSSQSELGFGSLVSVGSIIFDNTENLEVLKFPQLQFVEDIKLSRNHDLTVLIFSLLDESKGILELVNNENLQNISFPILQNITGSLNINENFELKNLDFPVLERVFGELNLITNITRNILEIFPKLSLVEEIIHLCNEYGCCDSLDCILEKFICSDIDHCISCNTNNECVQCAQNYFVNSGSCLNCDTQSGNCNEETHGSLSQNESENFDTHSEEDNIIEIPDTINPESQSEHDPELSSSSDLSLELVDELIEFIDTFLTYDSIDVTYGTLVLIQSIILVDGDLSLKTSDLQLDGSSLIVSSMHSEGGTVSMDDQSQLNVTGCVEGNVTVNVDIEETEENRVNLINIGCASNDNFDFLINRLKENECMEDKVVKTSSGFDLISKNNCNEKSLILYVVIPIGIIVLLSGSLLSAYFLHKNNKHQEMTKLNVDMKVVVM